MAMVMNQDCRPLCVRCLRLRFLRRLGHDPKPFLTDSDMNHFEARLRARHSEYAEPYYASPPSPLTWPGEA